MLLETRSVCRLDRAATVVGISVRPLPKRGREWEGGGGGGGIEIDIEI